MQTRTAIATALAGIVLGISGTTSPAAAATPSGGGWCTQRLGDTTPCVVTRHEFNEVHRVMLRQDVHRIFGVRGRRVVQYFDPVTGDYHLTLWYPADNATGWAVVDYRDHCDSGVLKVFYTYWPS